MKITTQNNEKCNKVLRSNFHYFFRYKAKNIFALYRSFDQNTEKFYFRRLSKWFNGRYFIPELPFKNSLILLVNMMW